MMSEHIMIKNPELEALQMRIEALKDASMFDKAACADKALDQSFKTFKELFFRIERLEAALEKKD